ncbi:hypothetical protein ACSBOB_04395 [Mesorhizobium sp. ASY16-5R]|uniref:hypothetical protein n=1 Tax=Mesorhizobium sp. ASY16-5R TaxID=3445772 RepID=UPI003FA04A6A
MGVDYHVAVHASDWPTPAAINRCLGELHYPIVIAVVPGAMDKPLTEAPGVGGFVVTFEGKPVELEVSVTRLGPDSPYAFTINPELLKQQETHPDGTGHFIARPTGMQDFVPRNLNADLSELGVSTPDYGDGDYVINLTFRSDVLPWRAGWFLMAGMIKCANGLGFEFGDGFHGRAKYADWLAKKAADPDYWK